MNTSPLPPISTAHEVALTKAFVQTLLKKANHQNVIIAVSGGIDSATSLNLLAQSVPKEHIFVVHLYYFEKSIEMFQKTIQPLNIPEKNVLLYSIKDAVDEIAGNLEINRDLRSEISRDDSLNKVRLGNIMARVRMIHLFDLAKKHKALVCGTENRSEYHLGYFTRFGDAASDFEVINHLYKTQVRELAQYLKVPHEIIEVAPSAGLWDDQTDEDEMGFSYEEADPVLYLYFEKGRAISEIVAEGYPHAKNIIETAKKNSFKHEVPYVMG